MLQMRIIRSPNFIQVEVEAVRNGSLSGRKLVAVGPLLWSGLSLFSQPPHVVIESETLSGSTVSYGHYRPQSTTAHTTGPIMLSNINNWFAFFLQKLPNDYFLCCSVLTVSQSILHLFLWVVLVTVLVLVINVGPLLIVSYFSTSIIMNSNAL